MSKNDGKISYVTAGDKGGKVVHESAVASHLNFDYNSNRARASRGDINNLRYSSKPDMNSLGMTYTDVRGKEMVAICLDTYNHVGIVKNIIDLMTDFATEGIDIIHDSDSYMKFFSVWKDKIRMEETVNKMTRTLMAAGNLCIQRMTKTIGKDEENEMRRGTAAVNTDKVRSRVIPYRYKIINPMSLSHVGLDEDGDVIIDVIKGNKTSKKRVSSDPNYFIAHYKRDDWELYGKPFHYAALDDLAFENKMKRMDSAAMDGVINMIRIWKIGGQLKDGTPIFPDAGATSKLATILENDSNGGVLDIIWDQFLNLEVTYPDVDKILGSDKYSHARQKILEDFGIAQVLLDGGGQGSYSNQYLSIASLMEKLKYVRSIVKEWITREVKFIAKNMNMKKLPEIKFKHIDLSDKNAERAIALQCVDRGLMSKEQFLQYFNESWSIEKKRIIKEKKEEENTPVLTKFSPSNILPYPVKNLENPSDGIVNQPDVEPKKQPNDGGRPSNQPNEKTQTKKRNTKPQGAGLVFIDYLEESKRIFEDIANLIDPKYLKANKAKNVKSLSREKKSELDDFKFMVMTSCDFGKDIKGDFLDNFIEKDINYGVKKVYANILNGFKEKNYRSPTKEENDELKKYSWAVYHFEQGVGNV